ncbi:hypothetical protein VNO78_26264 [Psophocarpus tetragonolobus]|uniref:Rhamnogalacturonase A/B/Epimerase-like pectate lyase domain-containing protein n=1 Tax=Psophocarpus tetragonolobus TaxID=3891 RepID=A0AAN9S015_PSOTE
MITLNIVNFGAKADGETDSTKAFLSAWNRACSSTTPTTIYVPLGRNWLFFYDVDGASLIGGVLDGQGTGLWACKRSGETCPSGSTIDNVKVQGVKVSAAGNTTNTDGIHVQHSSSVTILNSNIATGDDFISIGPGTTNLWIQNIACGPGHGISVGSLGKEFKEPGVQNVTVKTVTFTGTANGVRIKSWGDLATDLQGTSFSNMLPWLMTKIPLLLTQIIAPIKRIVLVSGVEISNIMYQDIHGTSATQVAVKMNCSPKYPCTRISLEDVMLTYENRNAVASCTHAGGITSGVIQPKNCFLKNSIRARGGA